VEFEESLAKDFDRLVDSFENDVLYYHPVKLSRWKTRRYNSQANITDVTNV
jgi:hypothetical protein